jgi:hypothetical protein
MKIVQLSVLLILEVKTVYQTNITLSAGKHSLRISGIHPGIYFVKLTAISVTDSKWFSYKKSQ